MIIALTGNQQSGKDTIAKMIQYYHYSKRKGISSFLLDDFLKNENEWYDRIMKFENPNWQIKKFALKLKQQAADLVGCSVEDFENEEFKATVMPKQFQIKYEHPVDNHITYSQHTYRWLLQHLADKIKELLGENYFVDELFSSYEDGKIKNAEPNRINDEPGILRRTRNLESNWIISDMRYLYEAKAVKERGGIIIKIERHNEHNHTHSSETELSKIKSDFTIQNNSTLDALYEHVSNILNQLYK